MRQLSILVMASFILGNSDVADTLQKSAIIEEVAAQSCEYDAGILDLGINNFDQDMTGGWRAVSSIPGCEGQAADIIEEYRDNLQKNMSILFWHEGQLRALSGETEKAILLMKKSKKAKSDPFGWNLYVDATIAFLRRNRKDLVLARSQLAKVPPIPDSRCVDIKGSVITCSAWPPNLDVVDALLGCLGKSYAEANSVASCRKIEPTTTK